MRGERCGPARQEGVRAAARRKRHARGRARLKAGATRARGGAHVEHVAYVCDAGGVEAQRLVERPRVLPSRKRRAGLGRLKAGGQGTRGAHVEHVLHGCDLGRVEAQRLVERRRLLPSRKEGVRCGVRCGPGAGGHGPAAAHERHARREGPAVKAGRARACTERTLNM